MTPAEIRGERCKCKPLRGVALLHLHLSPAPGCSMKDREPEQLDILTAIEAAEQGFADWEPAT
jgi:hypothetical protein